MRASVPGIPRQPSLVVQDIASRHAGNLSRPQLRIEKWPRIEWYRKDEALLAFKLTWQATCALFASRYEPMTHERPDSVIEICSV